MSSQGAADRYAKNMLRYENKKMSSGVIGYDRFLGAYAAGSVVNLETTGESSWNVPVFLTHVRQDLVRARTKLFFRKCYKYHPIHPCTQSGGHFLSLMSPLHLLIRCSFRCTRSFPYHISEKHTPPIWKPVKGNKISVVLGACNTGEMNITSVRPENGKMCIRASSVPQDHNDKSSKSEVLPDALICPIPAPSILFLPQRPISPYTADLPVLCMMPSAYHLTGHTGVTISAIGRERDGCLG